MHRLQPENQEYETMTTYVTSYNWVNRVLQGRCK